MTALYREHAVGLGRAALYTRGWNIHRLDLTTGRASTFAVPSGARQGKGDAPGLAW